MSELLKSLGICEKRAKATVACGVTVSELPSLASPDNVRYVSADKVTLGMYGLFLSKNTTVSRSSSNSEVHRHSINFYFSDIDKVTRNRGASRLAHFGTSAYCIILNTSHFSFVTRFEACVLSVCYWSVGGWLTVNTGNNSLLICTSGQSYRTTLHRKRTDSVYKDGHDRRYGGMPAGSESRRRSMPTLPRRALGCTVCRVCCANSRQ